MWWGTGFWWIVPVAGMAICMMVMLVMALFCFSRGCGGMKRRERH